MTAPTTPTLRVINWRELAKTYWGTEWTKPEVAYYFHDRQFMSTDAASTGIYED
jgi:hypothetical protein